MALLRKLRDLITLSREDPIFTDSPDVYPDLSGPAGDQAQALGLGDTVDFSQAMPNPEGPYRQVGTKRSASPFGAKLRAALPDMISSGITAAAHHNTAGGGPADFFGAMKDVADARQQKGQLGYARNRQMQQDSIANRKAAVDEQNLDRQNRRDEETASHQRTMDTRLAKTADDQAQAAIQKEINDAVGKGAQIIPPQAIPGLSQDDRARVRSIGGVNLKYPSETESFQRGRIKVTVPKELQDQGLPAEHYLKPEELDSWITAIKAKTPNLHFQEFKDDTTGDVVTVARDPATGAEKFRTTEKGVAKKRDPQGPQGSFIPTTNEQGEITGAWNPTTGQMSKPPEGGLRKSGLPEAALTARAVLLNSITDAETLGQLGEKYQKHIGVLKGRLDDAQRKTLGVDEGINDMFRIADDLADKLLRARSGAAITEGEYARLRALMPDPRSPYVKFKSDLRLFLDDARRTYKGKTGKDAPAGHPAANSGTQVKEQKSPSTGQYRYSTDGGKTWLPGRAPQQ